MSDIIFGYSDSGRENGKDVTQLNISVSFFIKYSTHFLVLCLVV